MSAAPPLLAQVAGSGRHMLVAGLLVAVVWPPIGEAMRPTVGPLIALLLALSAARIGAREAFGATRDRWASLGLAVFLQTGVPLAAIALLAGAGLSATPIAAAAVLMLSAAPISGGPSLCLMAGLPPAPALRMLVIGTMILPLTVVPSFFWIPQLGSADAVAAGAGRLLATIVGAGLVGFGLRRLLGPDLRPGTAAGLDAASALALALVVVGIMAPVGHALRTDPAALAGWLALAVALNGGMHAAVAFGARRAGLGRAAGSLGIVAGNRNVALFLLALPPERTEDLLLFIGCYQVPMYLTPLLIRRIYAPPL